ncbi:MAG: hypothetical protein H0T62_06060 [Parachlamydiaceae bacterium]|nr:hypothetical protein [Parachlamydiaceae bacterium]
MAAPAPINLPDHKGNPLTLYPADHPTLPNQRKFPDTPYQAANPGQPLHVEEYGQSLYPKVGAPGAFIEDRTSLHPGKYLLTLTLNRILTLLTKTIESLQSVAVQQANRLTFLTEWQKAYTARMNGVHTFSQLNGDAYVDGTDKDRSTDRQSLNQTNSTYIEADRSNNNIIADTAKALQTNINQTQDAVNQQSNMLTSLLQQLNSINQAIQK